MMSHIAVLVAVGALLPLQSEKDDRALAAIETAQARKAPDAVVGLCSYFLDWFSWRLESGL